MKRPLGCLSGIGLIAALMAVLAISLAVVATGGMLFSPGELNAEVSGEALGGVRSHAETGGECASCHAPPWSREGMADRCANCHTAMRDPASHLAQFHSLLWAETPEPPCRVCHPEHRGATASLTEISVTDFPHDATGFSLVAHREAEPNRAFACADCHLDGLTAFDVETCDRCHEDRDPIYMAAHRQDFGARCLGCHDGADRFSGFDHSRVAFALTGAHTQTQCGACHAGAAAPVDFASAPGQCIDCHRADDAHQGGLGTDCGACHAADTWEGAAFDHSGAQFPLEGEHADVECDQCHRAGRFKGTPVQCVGCHQKDDPHEGALGADCAACHTPEDWKKVAFDHNKSRFALAGQHAGVECTECHVDSRFRGTPTQCVECHREDDAHRGELGSECAACHTPDDWQTVTFDHATTRFLLAGGHASVQCVKCHAGGRFKGTPTQCVECHREDDAHQGQFGTDCAACHTSEDWKKATFDHSKTAFPLTGAHQEVRCARCHEDGKFKGTSAACSGCHQDPAFHRSLFAQGCDACHSTIAWLPARFELPHVFPVNHGASGPSACRTCHPDALAAYICYGCHEHDPAGIQAEHAEEGIGDIANCVKCHPTGQEGENGGDGGGGGNGGDEGGSDDD